MIYAFGEFQLDLRLFELRQGEAAVPVQPKVLDLLAFLVRNRERVVSKQELLDEVWPDEIVSETALTHAVMEARRAVCDDGNHQRFIRTVRRRGYRFIAAVEELDGAGLTPPARSVAEGWPEGPFVGRDRAMTILRSDLDQAVAGATRLALLVGEPGIGKTRTAEELAAVARATGVEVLVGRCSEAEGAPAYWPWVQIVRGFVERRERAALEALLGARAGVIGQAIPEVAEKLGELPDPPELDPSQARFRLFDALAGFLRGAAAAGPLLLVIDDLHRADRPSLLLLQFVVREVRDARLMIVGTYRDAELARDAGLARVMSEVVREDPSRTLELDGLARVDVARFLEEATGQTPPEALVTSLRDRTGGNPFFLTQLVQVLESEGRLEDLAAETSWDVPLSQGVREAIRRHLDVLDGACREVLVLASVIGREFPLAALAHASGTPSEELLGHLGTAIGARVVSEVPAGIGQYCFSHSLIRETLYGELAPAKRVQLHGRIGEALAALHGANAEPHLAELAHHFVQAAAAGKATQAIDYSVRAAERATQQLAYEQAAAHYERALGAMQLAPVEPRERCQLLIALGAAHWRAGEGERARERYLDAAEVARALADAELLARAAVGFGVWDQDDLVDEVLVRLLEDSLALLPEADSALRARVMGRLARELKFAAGWDQLEGLSHGAVEMARRVGDTAALGEALVARHWALWGPENTEDRFSAAVEIVQLAEASGYQPLALQGRQFRLADLLELGDIRGVDLEINAISWLADELQRPTHLWFVAVFRGMRAQMSGRFDEAQGLAERGLKIGERVHRETALQWYGAQMAALNRARGRLDEAAAALQIFRTQNPWVPTWHCELALTLALAGREDHARAEFGDLAASDFRDLRRDLTWLASLGLLAELCAILDDSARAAVLYEMLLPHAGRTVSGGPGVVCYGSAARFLGLLATTLGRFKEGRAHFEEALTANERSAARPLLATTQADYARMLEREGRPADRSRARELGASALETAVELGMEPLAASARELARPGRRRRPPS